MNLRTAFIRIAHENPETRSTLLPLVKQADKWETLPKGWTDESRKQFWETLTGDVKHKVTKCIKEMEGKFDDPGAFCASLADRVNPGWRSRTAAAPAIKDGMKVKALGVTGKGLVEGQTYTLNKSTTLNGLDTYNFVNSRGKSVSRFTEESIERWLRSGVAGDSNGLILADRRASQQANRTAMEHSSPESLRNYLKDHPNADPKNHTVKKAPEKDEKAETSGKEGWKSDPEVQKASKEREKAEKELKQLDEIFPNKKAELDKLTPQFNKLKEKAYEEGYLERPLIGMGGDKLSEDDVNRLEEFVRDYGNEDLDIEISDYLYLKEDVAKGPPSKGERALYVERLEKATKKEEEAIDAYEEEAANAASEKDMAEAKKPEAKKPDAAGKKDEEAAGKQASLRARVIRLAHTHPELRAALLPLLK
jgi:hypothetical protein